MWCRTARTRFFRLICLSSALAIPAAAMPTDTTRLDLRQAASALAASLSDIDTSAWRSLPERQLSAAGRKRSRDGLRVLAQLRRVGGGADVVQAFEGGGGLVVRLRARAVPRVVSVYMVADNAQPTRSAG